MPALAAAILVIALIAAAAFWRKPSAGPEPSMGEPNTEMSPPPEQTVGGKADLSSTTIFVGPRGEC